MLFRRPGCEKVVPAGQFEAGVQIGNEVGPHPDLKQGFDLSALFAVLR
jgi:hypothetical protein